MNRMSDLISRQAAIDIAMQYCPDDDGSCSKAGADIREMLDEFENLPSAQTEIVRCKDCKHWYSDADVGMACEFTNLGQPRDGFCNWGDRRSE